MLTVGSLFSGIGGLDLGLERAGMEVIWQSEIDPYACRVLKKHWPEVPNLGDIKRINWGDVVRPDVLCGGYPCQPFSTAGKRKGEEDPRHLWPWVRDAISVLRPRYAILENVRGHVSLGLSTVLGEMASIGYDAEWRIVSAASVGANHRRDRIIIVAYPNGSHKANGRKCQVVPGEGGSRGNDGSGSGSDIGEVSLGGPRENSSIVAYPDDARSRTSQCGIDRDGQTESEKRQDVAQSWLGGCGTDMADSNGERCDQRRVDDSPWVNRGGGEKSADDMADPESQGCNWYGQPWRPKSTFPVFASASAYRSIDHIAANWKTEPDVGRVAYGVPSRVDRLRGLGNAVVPQVAEVIGRLVVEHANN